MKQVDIWVVLLVPGNVQQLGGGGVDVNEEGPGRAG